MLEPRSNVHGQPRQVLTICGDQYHAASQVMSGLTRVGKAEFHFHQADDAAPLAKGKNFDAIVLAKLNVKSPEDSCPWADETSGKLIEEFVACGGGLLVIHAGTVGYQPAAGIRRLTGGSFLHHPQACEVDLVPSKHPLAAGVAPFTVHDEHYFMEVDSNVEVFMTSISVHGSQPAAWKQELENGKICTLTPGHGPNVWANESFQQLLENALRWVSNG